MTKLSKRDKDALAKQGILFLEKNNKRSICAALASQGKGKAALRESIAECKKKGMKGITRKELEAAARKAGFKFEHRKTVALEALGKPARRKRSPEDIWKMSDEDRGRELIAEISGPVLSDKEAAEIRGLFGGTGEKKVKVLRFETSYDAEILDISPFAVKPGFSNPVNFKILVRVDDGGIPPNSKILVKADGRDISDVPITGDVDDDNELAVEADITIPNRTQTLSFLIKSVDIKDAYAYIVPVPTPSQKMPSLFYVHPSEAAWKAVYGDRYEDYLVLGRDYDNTKTLGFRLGWEKGLVPFGGPGREISDERKNKGDESGTQYAGFLTDYAPYSILVLYSSHDVPDKAIKDAENQAGDDGKKYCDDRFKAVIVMYEGSLVTDKGYAVCNVPTLVAKCGKWDHTEERTFDQFIDRLDKSEA